MGGPRSRLLREQTPRTRTGQAAPEGCGHGDATGAHCISPKHHDEESMDYGEVSGEKTNSKNSQRCSPRLSPRLRVSASSMRRSVFVKRVLAFFRSNLQ